jgi:hypothetical protein
MHEGNSAMRRWIDTNRPVDANDAAQLLNRVASSEPPVASPGL